jgi:hypothetical protein
MHQCHEAFAIKDLLSPGFTGLMAFGGILLSSWLNSRQVERRQLNEVRLECYAQWSVSMAERMRIYAKQLDKPIPSDDFKVIHAKLLMMEPDPVLRALIKGIWDTIPKLWTPDSRELLEVSAREPDFVWPPFQEKMDELVDRVHATRNPKPWWRSRND